MSKKLLALLVAVSTCCAFGCSDDDSDSCKTGEKRCDGNNAQICVNGNWSKGTPCADGCDKATGVCIDPPVTCKTAGEKRCSGKQLQECKDGNWSKLEDCKDSCDEATKACVIPSGKCTATSTSQCTGSCSADKKTGYFWSKEALKTVDCPNADCTDTNGYVQCGEPPACTATSTERCNVACSADKSVGYYWNGKENKVGERKCPNKDCTIEGTSVKCAGAATCDQKPVCNEAGNKVTYCSSSSGLTDKDCPQCYVDDDTFWCNGDQNLPKCAKGATSKCIGTCLSDTEGVFWDNNTNAVKDKTCTDPKKCNATKSGYVSCK